MKDYKVNPVHWRVDTLLASGTGVIHNLAVCAAGTLTAYRLILGRCLLAMDLSKAYKEFSCSSSIHYAIAKLGVSRRQALEARRVADQLRPFANLKLAAERGKITWSKLREIVRKATPANEDYWLELAKRLDADDIEALVGVTPKGELPGEVAPDRPYCTTELRCRVGPEIFQLLKHARRTLAIQQGRMVTTEETLEWVLSAYLAGEPLDKVGLERLRCQTDRDLAAEFSRTLPMVEQARELAVEMGFLAANDDEQDQPGRVKAEESMLETTEYISLGEELLAQALGAPALEGVELHKSEPGRVQTETPTYTFWENGRLRFNPKRRLPTRAQRKEILRRDGYRCSTPGCPHFAWLHIHHLEPFAKGGGTTEANLLCLCSRCHTNVHEGRLVIERGDRGRLVFLDGEGRRLDRCVKLRLAEWLDTWLFIEGEVRSEKGVLTGDRQIDGIGSVREAHVAGDWAC